MTSQNLQQSLCLSKSGILKIQWKKYWLIIGSIKFTLVGACLALFQAPLLGRGSGDDTDWEAHPIRLTATKPQSVGSDTINAR